MSKREDVVVVAAARTGMGLFGGSLKDFLGVDLATLVIKEILKRAQLTECPERVGDVILGQILGRVKEEANVARVAAWRAGIPKEVPAMNLQRACASGLQAAISGAQEIQVGQCDIVIAGGTESMTNSPYELYGLRWGKRWRNDEIFDCMYAPLLNLPPTGTGMGLTAENLAEQCDISRSSMDEYSLESHARSARATAQGLFRDEILGINLPGPKGQPPVVFDRDESIRQTTLEKLGALPPAFKEGGRVTAGNACPINDGAAALCLMRREVADQLGLQPLLRLVSYAVVGVDPDIMGYGPIPATRKALEKAALSLGDIDLFEVNEAFAPVPLAYMKELGVPHTVMNVNGGAIAMGHPVGASGARLVVTIAYEMARRGARRGITAICQGSGMGTAAIWERDA